MQYIRNNSLLSVFFESDVIFILGGTLQGLLKKWVFLAFYCFFINPFFYYYKCSILNINLKYNVLSIMQEDSKNFAVNCTAPQDGEKIFKELRDWSESEYQEEMESLGIDDSNMSWERKKILVILYMLNGVRDKEGWFYIDNSNLSEICNVGERTITRVKRDFERLGIIKIKRGYQGSPTRYKFFEKKLNKLPKISKKTPESTLAPLAGKNVIPATENEIYKSVIDSLLSSCAQVPAKVDNKKIEKKNIVEGGVQYKDKEQYKKQYEYQEQELEQNEYKEQDEYKKQMDQILYDNNARLIENINNISQGIVNTIIQLMTNTKDETIEEFKKLYTSIDNITKVQLEHNTKLDKLFELVEEKDKVIEGKDKLINELQAKLQSSSMDSNGKSNGVVQEEVNTKVVEELQGKIDKLQEDSNSKVIEESDSSKDVNKSSSKSCGEVQYPSSITFQHKENELTPKVEDTKEFEQEPSREETKESPRQEQTPKVVIKTVIKTTHQEASNPKKVETSKAEEQKQLQELKETLKPLLENFNEVGTSEEHERILNEIRKAYTTKGYSQKILQPFLDFALTYNFYAEKRDIVEEPKQEETVTPSEEPRDEDYWNPTFTDEQAQEALSRLQKPNNRLKEDDDQEEVIDDDMPSDKEVASVVGGYDEENDAMF